MQCVADASDGISTPQRSFVGLCEAMPTNRRFPPPWPVEDSGACFVEKDNSGQKLAYIYLEDGQDGGVPLAVVLN